MVDVSEEEWRPVVEHGYEAHYEVSSLGRVRRTQTQRVLKPGAHPKGYRSLVLSVNKERRTVLVHRLVLMAFVGPAPDGHESLHGNGDRSDNALSNLKWGTSVENQHDKRRHGTMTYGERNGNSKLTGPEVAALIMDYTTKGISQRALAARYGISQPQVSRIVTGKQRGPHSEE